MQRWCRRFLGMVPHMLGPLLEMGPCCKWQSVTLLLSYERFSGIRMCSFLVFYLALIFAPLVVHL